MWSLIKILFLLIPFLLLSCKKSPKNSDNVIDISEEIAQIKKDASITLNSENLIKLPTQDKISSDITIGNKNPFSADNSVRSLLSSEDLKLTGILSTKAESLAFVKYKENSGVLKVGEIGGKNTNLLPEGYKSISIDKSKAELVIKYKNEKYILKLFNESKLLKSLNEV